MRIYDCLCMPLPTRPKRYVTSRHLSPPYQEVPTDITTDGRDSTNVTYPPHGTIIAAAIAVPIRKFILTADHPQPETWFHRLEGTASVEREECELDRSIETTHPEDDVTTVKMEYEMISISSISNNLSLVKLSLCLLLSCKNLPFALLH